jgi:HD-GYP domain-containing protein (c-di-GMP phosphodiesterase class II)
MPAGSACEELLRCSGTQFDPAIVDAFLTALERGEEDADAHPSVARAA